MACWKACASTTSPPLKATDWLTMAVRADGSGKATTMPGANCQLGT
jgi:hypothetical protein